MSVDNRMTIRDIAQVYDGPHATPEKIDEGPYFLSISSLEKGALDLSKSAHISETDFVKWTKRVTPEEGDLLFSYETRLGDAALMPAGIVGCLGRRMGLLRPNREKVIPEYLLYAYLSPEFQEIIRANTVHGATVDRIALKDMSSFSIRIPPLADQERVVSVLSSQDKKIQLNRQINQTLESMAQAIFQSWFVDFDPVKAKIAAREQWQTLSDGERREWLNEMINKQAFLKTCLSELTANGEQSASETLYLNIAAMTTISSRNEISLAEMPADEFSQLYKTASLFPKRLVDSELGEIPEGWEFKRLSDLADKISKGTTPNKKDIANSGDSEIIPFLKVRDISDDGEIQRNDLDMIQKSIHESSLKRSILKKDDLLFSIAGTIGRVAVVEEDLSNSNCNQALAFIRLLEPLNFLEICRLNLVSKRVQDEVLSKVVQGVQSNFSLTGLGNIEILIPESEFLNEFNSIVNSLRGLHINNSTEIRNLGFMRDTLLPILLSGELDVSSLTELSDIDPAEMDV
ncbi:MAG: restriction endonuclease S subunit [Thalassolituus sp.]|jgi:restriction endonuclease S subunit